MLLQLREHVLHKHIHAYILTLICTQYINICKLTCIYVHSLHVCFFYTNTYCIQTCKYILTHTYFNTRAVMYIHMDLHAYTYYIQTIYKHTQGSPSVLDESVCSLKLL